VSLSFTVSEINRDIGRDIGRDIFKLLSTQQHRRKTVTNIFAPFCARSQLCQVVSTDSTKKFCLLAAQARYRQTEKWSQ